LRTDLLSLKSQIISEELPLPAAIDLVSAMIKGAAQQLDPIPLSHDLLKNKRMMPSPNLRSIFLQRLFKLESKYTQYFPYNLPSNQQIRDPFVQPTPSFTLTRKRKLNLPCDGFLKRKFNSGNLTKFIEWRKPNFGETNTTNGYPFRYVVFIRSRTLCHRGD